MIEYSDHESKIFKVKFGRIEIEDTAKWDMISSEITSQRYDYIRFKIRDPKSEDIDQLHLLSKNTFLLEILRVYQFETPQNLTLPNTHDDLHFEPVNAGNTDELRSMIRQSYEDIPFGNYTSSRLLEKFSLQEQRENLETYFLSKYCGQDDSHLAFIIKDSDGCLIGCVLTKIFSDKNYSYYVGILRAHRNRDTMNKAINFLKHLTIYRGVKIGEGAARLSNLYSQKAFERNEMQCIGYDWIYLLEF
jgi:hypothetical protein